jgi:pyruvate, water dikinase
MNISEHLLYQNIIKYHNAYDCILNAFRRALADFDADVPDITGHKRSSKFAAELIAAVFDLLSLEDIEEYINLGRKEKIARSLMHFLNSEKYNATKIRSMLEEFSRIPAGRIHLSTTMTLDIRVNLISHFISNHLEYIGIAKNYINMRDVTAIISRSVSVPGTTGTIGGKSAGMLLANRILRPSLDPEAAEEFNDYITETDSWYVRSSIINEFIADNQLEECHSLKYLEGDEFEQEYDILFERFMQGRFSSRTLNQFKQILNDAEGCPLILRSSSFLEDSINCSFTGKYDSFFISNRGTEKERITEFTKAIKKVYMSLYGASVIQYRKDRSLLDYNEKMSVLVQKVVGQEYGKYFFPAIGIVGFSHNPYCWNRKIKPEDGMLRMVMGLGTRAVDRVGDDYPRIISLSAPQLRPEGNDREKIRYSQKYVDVLNLESHEVETIHFVDLANYMLEQRCNFPFREFISVEKDGVFAPPMLMPDRFEYDKCALTFEGLLNKPDFALIMKRVFSKVGAVYDIPVDMEFAYDNNRLYVLQCRSLCSGGDGAGDSIEIPAVADADCLFKTTGCVRSASLNNIEYAIYVDSEHYHALPTLEKRFEVARLVGMINRQLAERRFILMGPGRWGTNNPELGLSVKYADINNSLVLAEIGLGNNGETPELSYGTHFFQDLVEADIIPLPLFPEQPDNYLNLSLLSNAVSCLPKDVSIPAEYEQVIKLIDFAQASGGRLLQLRLDSHSKRGIAFLAQRTVVPIVCSV